MQLAFVISALLAIAVGAETQAAAGEIQLKPGAFPLVRNAAIGKPLDFENEIDTHTCYPLLIGGEVIAWLSRAHAFGHTLLVQRCIEFDPSVKQTAGNRHGGVKAAWDRVVKGPGDVGFAALSVTGWGRLSSPSFCGPQVAYWTIRNGQLGLAVYDLSRRVVIASHRLTQSEPETDDESALPEAEWNAKCSVATFSTDAGGIALRIPVRMK